jgi:ABC-type nitrate/sulfonate/bicarbonate transport system substrate-binding protein
MTWDDLSPESVGRYHARQRLAEHAEVLAGMRAGDDPNRPDDVRAYLAAYREVCHEIAKRLRAVDAPANGQEGTLRGVSGRGQGKVAGSTENPSVRL